MNDLGDVLRDFLIESYENLDQLDRDLVTLEQEPGSRPLLSNIFRTIHTIKGTCGFLGLSKLEAVTHAGENLLSKLRDGEIGLEPAVTTGLLSLVDAVRQILANLEDGGAEGDEDHTHVIRSLIEIQEAALRGQAVAGEASAVAAEDDPAESRPAGISDSTIRVDVGVLDQLMNCVGELVLARNRVLQFQNALGDSAFDSVSQRLSSITTELQAEVMKTRMQPIGSLWSKYSRLVRDLTIACGKKVRLETEGEETELDKTIVEAIKDPLTHLVRNALDHGIESPEARLRAGKPEEGRVLLRAFHEGGQVSIEIADDGGGLNLPRIKQKGVERGMLTPDQAARLNDRDAQQLIFAPGFSTAEQVTNVSGRGVGMDVVRTNIEKIGGTVEIQSQPGQGTTIRLKIPLTLAIVPALIVTCGGDRYAIPQASLLELVRLEGKQARHGIERLHLAPVYRLRGQLLPIVYLGQELGLEQLTGQTSGCADVVNIVVLRADDQPFGLVVDAINDTEEIVVKPLSRQLKGIPLYAGATIMGDGRIALILDVMGIARQAGIVSEARHRRRDGHPTPIDKTESPEQTLLILQVGRRRLALPLAMVSRLEKIDRRQIEQSDARPVVQYRQQIMTLAYLAELLGEGKSHTDPEEPLQVVVCSWEDQYIGLVVDRIADVACAHCDVQRPARHEALLGSAVIQNRVTDLLDLPQILRWVDPLFAVPAQAV